MHIVNNYNALWPLITLYNALYIKALSNVLPKNLSVVDQKVKIKYARMNPSQWDE